MDKPEKVNAAAIDSYLGGLPHEAVPTRSEYFIEGTEPKDLSPYYKKLKISKSTGKLANDVEIKTGNYEEKEYIMISENDPVSTDEKNRWQEAIDAWAREQKDDKYHPPTETSEAASDVVVVQIKSPSDKETVNSNNIEIKGKIASVNPIKTTKFYINGSEIRILDGNISEFNETFNLTDGVYEIKVMSWNEKDKNGDSQIKIGVNKPWNFASPTPSLSPTPAL
ncbi:Ig-like domain-containing protein [Candidatus Roizmanbacteria bacterium]|nr:Ig-like domain-containing protein [Candidatus Roizmanbacteria bacterium]